MIHSHVLCNWGRCSQRDSNAGPQILVSFSLTALTPCAVTFCFPSVLPSGPVGSSRARAHHIPLDGPKPSLCLAGGTSSVFVKGVEEC